ncbi:MAG TPA: LpqB family beta-propeller domain-containing protein [Nocardioides sp.]
MRRRPAVIGAAVCALLGAALSGCVEIPDHGSIRTVQDVGDTAVESELEHFPPGPQKGAQKSAIVDGWFEAMTAAPVSATVARQFLLPRSAEGWSPDGSFLVYETASLPEGAGPLTKTLFRVNEFNSRGQWVGTQRTREIAFDLDVESTGQWRIKAIRDLGGEETVPARKSVIVPSAWFTQQVEPMSLYFYSGSDKVLVPEPVYLPQGDQQPTLLVRALLAGPVNRQVEHTFAPAGVKLPSVTVDRDGTADIPLTGLSPDTPPETVERMATQFAWTLQQIPTIKAVRILVDGEPLPLPDGETTYAADDAFDLDPTGTGALNALYGLRGGLAVRIIDGIEQQLRGAFGQRDYGLRDISVSLDSAQMAGVNRNGDRILISGVTGGEGGASPAPRTVFTGGTDLMHPAWDLAGRMWVVDRRAKGAAVWVLRAGTRQRVQIPGVSGERVVDFLVSRDGTRFVAAVRGPHGDRIVVNRIVAAGGSVRATRSRQVLSYEGSDQSIRDIGWRSPTSISYLSAAADRPAELHSAILDGAPSVFDPKSLYATLDATDLRVIGSPRESESMYLQHADNVFEPLSAGGPAIPAGVVALTYVG